MIREHLHYIPRGAFFRIGKLNMMGFGGSFSVNKRYLKEHITWWPQEEPTLGDAYRAVLNHRSHDVEIDLMICHDTVTGAPVGELTKGSKFADEYHPEADRVRKLVHSVIEKIEPNFMIHGHYHNNLYYEVDIKDGYRLPILGLDKTKESRGYSSPIHKKAYHIIDTNQRLEKLYV
jgi:hypothetical protein